METKMILDGVRVIDWTGFVVGSSGCARLADLGADVIKIELRGRGDPQRGLRYFYGVNLERPDGHNIGFEATNRNKRSLSLNLTIPEGREIMKRLVEQSDIFVTNFRMKARQALGVDYETLSTYNPRLIYVSATSFGEKGPDAHLASFDSSVQARGGIMTNTGQPGMPPMLTALGMFDHATSLNVAYGALAGLIARDRYGTGQKIETSLLASCIDLNQWINGVYFFSGEPQPRQDRSAPGNPLFNYYRCKDDRWILLTSMLERNWVPFCEVIGMPELESDPRFNTVEKRMENSRELTGILDSVFATQECEKWMSVFKDADILYAPVQETSELLSDPQVIENEYFCEFDHDYFGKVKYTASPVKFSQNPTSIRRRAPVYGEHTEEVLLELGYSWQDIVRFSEKEAI